VDDPHVRYLEIAGVGRDAFPHTSAFFAPTFLFVHARAGRNDGVVPMTSALRGRTPFDMWAADHADLIGHDLNGPTPLSTPRLTTFGHTNHLHQRRNSPGA
jgi:hypothetical protein